MEEKKNKSLIIIIVILVILLSCSVGYIVYDNFIKEDEVTENNDIQNNNNNDNQDNNNDNQDNGGNNEEENDELSEEELERLGENLFNKTNILLTPTKLGGLIQRNLQLLEKEGLHITSKRAANERLWHCSYEEPSENNE